MALEQHELLFFTIYVRLIDPHPLTSDLWENGAYQVTLTDYPEHIVALGTRADPLLTEIASTTEAASLLKDGVAECWTSWSFCNSGFFNCILSVSTLMLEIPPDVHMEFSGLGGQVWDNFVSDLLVQCVPSAPCYGASSSTSGCVQSEFQAP